LTCHVLTDVQGAIIEPFCLGAAVIGEPEGPGDDVGQRHVGRLMRENGITVE